MKGRRVALGGLADIKEDKGKKILDVGCSYPWFLSYVQKNGAKEVAGIEPDIVKVKAARKQVPKAKILQGHAGDLKFTNKSFDLVTLFDVIEHIPSNTEPDTLKEINRVLKPGGHLIISTPLAHWFSMITDPAWYFGHRHYSENQLSEMLEKTGFKIKSVVTHGGIWEIIGMWVLYISKWIFKIKMPLKIGLTQREEKNLKKGLYSYYVDCPENYLILLTASNPIEYSGFSWYINNELSPPKLPNQCPEKFRFPS